MTTITTLRAVNDNVSPASLLAVAQWNENESLSGRKRYTKADVARQRRQSIELRTTAYLLAKHGGAA